MPGFYSLATCEVYSSKASLCCRVGSTAGVPCFDTRNVPKRHQLRGVQKSFSLAPASALLPSHKGLCAWHLPASASPGAIKIEGQQHLKVLFPHHPPAQAGALPLVPAAAGWGGSFRAALREGDLKVFSSSLFIRSQSDKQPRSHRPARLS